VQRQGVQEGSIGPSLQAIGMATQFHVTMFKPGPRGLGQRELPPRQNNLIRVKEARRLERFKGGGDLHFCRRESLDDKVRIEGEWPWLSDDNSLDFSVSESSW